VTRGTVRPTTRVEAIGRALSMIGQPIEYQLKPHNGGGNPDAPDPATHWIDNERTPRATCDCAGFVAWCLGYDRYQPRNFPHWGGWINTDSMLFAAQVTSTWFAPSPYYDAEPGEIVVYGSRINPKTGKRVPGHVGIITHRFPQRVTHCSSGNFIRLGYAVAETDDAPWRNPAKGARYLRYLKFKEST